MPPTSKARCSKDAACMRVAISLSQFAVKAGCMPFGAVAADANGKILVQAYNNCKAAKNERGGAGDMTRHAEMELVRKLCQEVPCPDERKTLTIYTSTEPCVMCSGAIYWSGVKRVVYGCSASELESLSGPGGFDIPMEQLYSMGREGARQIEIVGPFLSKEAMKVHTKSGIWCHDHTDEDDDDNHNDDVNEDVNEDDDDATITTAAAHTQDNNSDPASKKRRLVPHLMETAPCYAKKFESGKWDTSSRAKYQQYVCKGARCKKRVRTFCKCDPGKWLCISCFSVHAIDATKKDNSSGAATAANEGDFEDTAFSRFLNELDVVPVTTTMTTSPTTANPPINHNDGDGDHDNDGNKDGDNDNHHNTSSQESQHDDSPVDHVLEMAPRHAKRFVAGKWDNSARAKYQQYRCRGPGCKKPTRTYCVCTPGEWLCPKCFGVHFADNVRVIV